MKKSEDIKIGEYTLKEIIERHHHWLEEDIEGWENMHADLNCADLRGVDLHGVDLRGAKLYCANLSGADLSDTDLSDADLSDANLSGADLNSVVLRGAVLNGADLSDADLSDANLRGADLRDADLYGADLCGAKGNLMEYRRGKILSENIIGYKKCKDNVIVTLEIPRGAIVFSINGYKCRTNKVKVVSIDGADRAYSENKYMSYYVGDEITVYNFNCEYNVECAEGIHFFMTRKEAEHYIL